MYVSIFAMKLVNYFFLQVGQFVQEKLNPQFGSVIKASSGLRNSVSQGAMHFSCVALDALDRRVMKGSANLPKSFFPSSAFVHDAMPH